MELQLRTNGTPLNRTNAVYSVLVDNKPLDKLNKETLLWVISILCEKVYTLQDHQDELQERILEVENEFEEYAMIEHGEL